MKKKVLITSILLGVTTIALIGYLVVGCSSMKDVVVRQAQDQAAVDEESKETAKSASGPQLAEVPADSSSMRQHERTEPENERGERSDYLVTSKLETGPKIPPADEHGYTRNWLETDGDEESKQKDQTARDHAVAQEHASKYLRYGIHQPNSSADGKSVNGDMMGGMGGYGGGIAPGGPVDGRGSYDGRTRGGGLGGQGGGYGGMGAAGGRTFNDARPTGPEARRRVPGLGNLPVTGDLFRAQSGPSGSVSTRTIPVELINVSADELWVIVRAEVQAVPVAPGDEGPGCGAMLAKLPKEDREIPLPLKHTDVKGQISGYIATVSVTQQFHNPYDEKIEAVYVFPLPQNAAINEFIMTIGERRIRGIIRERKEAERIYQEARRQGHVASLLTQERPNIFTQKVANIEPSKQIDVNIKYFNTLAYVDGWYEFVFPMVVGPRFNPCGSTDGVGAVARGKAGISGQSTEVQYLKPGERSGHDISLAVDIDAGVAIEKVVCASHVITNSSPERNRRTVKLSSLDSIPNKDFVLRYKVAGETVKSALMTHRDKRGGFFTLMLYPPGSLSSLRRAPMEMIFVLDCSGSMNGKPIAKAKQAITRALKKLQPDDTFQVIRFSNNASQLGPDPLPATPANIRRGLQYVESLQGSGGTMMIEGIKAALDFAHDPRRFRLVSFMTDGYIGNEGQILAEVSRRLGDSRIFSFGVGSSPNRYLLDRMAKLGKGAVAYVGLDDSVAEIVDEFYDRISHPALADVAIDWGGMEVTDVQPHRVPDLFVGRPVIVTGRFQGNGSTTIRVTGSVGDLTQEMAIPVHLDKAAETHPGIACVWARKKIETLGNQALYDSNPDLPGEIRQVALEYGLMSSYTAFIAVDSSRKTEGDHGITVAVPVPIPDGVRYETTVQN